MYPVFPTIHSDSISCLLTKRTPKNDLLLEQDFSQTTFVHYTWGPVVVAALAAYLIAHCFIAVYQMAIGKWST